MWNSSLFVFFWSLWVGLLLFICVTNVTIECNTPSSGYRAKLEVCMILHNVEFRISKELQFCFSAYMCRRFEVNVKMLYNDRLLHPYAALWLVNEMGACMFRYCHGNFGITVVMCAVMWLAVMSDDGRCRNSDFALQHILCIWANAVNLYWKIIHVAYLIDVQSKWIWDIFWFAF
jgi:hypothetical protein